MQWSLVKKQWKPQEDTKLPYNQCLQCWLSPFYLLLVLYVSHIYLLLWFMESCMNHIYTFSYGSWSFVCITYISSLMVHGVLYVSCTYATCRLICFHPDTCMNPSIWFSLLLLSPRPPTHSLFSPVDRSCSLSVKSVVRALVKMSFLCHFSDKTNTGE